MRLLTLSDSDSYLKWATALTTGAPPHWAVRHLVVENVIAPSPDQVAAVLRDHPGRPVGRVQAVDVARTVRRLAPDAVLVACTGPAVDAIMDLLSWGGVLGTPRPVLVTGLPGISYPANELAIGHRSGFDLMILHSHREMQAYAEVIDRLGGGPRLALASLPFLAQTAHRTAEGRAVVFAAQALVPPTTGQRQAILTALAALPPGLDPVVKVRALPGERQTHNEDLPYVQLWAELPRSRPVTFVGGSMADALSEAAGFVTVSSTAALEAIAAGVPTLILDEFGVNDALINTVFVGSGLLGGLGQLTAGQFRHPHEDWLTDNYFHAESDNDWVRAVEELHRSRHRLPVFTRAPHAWATRIRRQLRVLPPGLVWRVLRRFRTRTG